MATRHQHDVLVIGSGAAGLTAALHLPAHYRVALLSKADLNQGSTFWAQGGMAAVLHNRDTVDSHVADTLAAGERGHGILFKAEDVNCQALKDGNLHIRVPGKSNVTGTFSFAAHSGNGSNSWSARLPAWPRPDSRVSA